MAYDACYRPLGFQLQQNTTPIWKNGSFANTLYPYQYDGVGNIRSVGNMIADCPGRTSGSGLYC